MKTKMAHIVLTLGLFCCSSNVGTTQSEIEDNFDLSTAGNPTILRNCDDDAFPHMEFDSTNKDTFQILISDGNPVEKETTFEYDSAQYEVDGNNKILSGENAVGSNYKLTYDPDLATYSLVVDYNCSKIEDNLDCTNTVFDCTGPLQ